MKKELAEKLMRLHNLGYIVQVPNRYDGVPIDKIYERDGDIIFHSLVYSNASLLMISEKAVTVSKPLDSWWKQPIG